jgi:hypothetical protein
MFNRNILRQDAPQHLSFAYVEGLTLSALSAHFANTLCKVLIYNKLATLVDGLSIDTNT